MIQDTALKALAVVSGMFLLLLIAAPFAFPYGTFVHLNGSPSMMDHDWSPYGAMGLVYALGDLLCHQEYARSFLLNGSQMPVCIRDTALLIGLTAGLIGCIVLRDRVLDRRYLYAGLILVALTVLEWVAEHLTTLDSSELRFILGVASGIGVAIIIGHLLYRIDSGA